VWMTLKEAAGKPFSCRTCWQVDAK
jgi:hypothetical protein